MKRLFAAIKINPDAHFLSHYFRLKSDLKHDHIKWVEPENMHLTLKFFGEIPEERISSINKVIKPFSESIEPFTLTIVKAGVFGSRYKPRVIWFGIKDENRLKEYGNTLLQKLDQAGFENDRQNFVPHFTVGRIKELTNKEYFQRTLAKYKYLFLQEIHVEEIHLYESILRPEGPKYVRIENYLLGANWS